jgi:hypothetical protein
MFATAPAPPPHLTNPISSFEVVLADLRRLDWVARARVIDLLKRELVTLEQRTLCEMPGHLRWRTPQHADLRRRCFERDRHRCTACGRTRTLRMHHLSYKRVGMPDEINDVTTRCQPCHSFAHRYTKPGYHHRRGQTRMAA